MAAYGFARLLLLMSRPRTIRSRSSSPDSYWCRLSTLSRVIAAEELTLSESFGNPGVLPLLFPAHRRLVRRRRSGSCCPRLVALTSFYLIGFTPAFWALGNAILADDDPDAAC